MFRDEQITAGYLLQVVPVFFLCRQSTVFLHSPFENMLKSDETGILSLREKLLRADRNSLKYYSLNTHNFHWQHKAKQNDTKMTTTSRTMGLDKNIVKKKKTPKEEKLPFNFLT